MTTTPRTFVGPDGHMYRDKETAMPFRTWFAAWPHRGRITTVTQLKGAMRAGTMAFGGCRPYYVTTDGAAMCDRCVRQNLARIMDSISTNTHDGWNVRGVDMDNEEEDIACDNCGTPIGYQNEQDDIAQRINP